MCRRMKVAVAFEAHLRIYGRSVTRLRAPVHGDLGFRLEGSFACNRFYLKSGI
jgi:hypothetical protein